MFPLLLITRIYVPKIAEMIVAKLTLLPSPGNAIGAPWHDVLLRPPYGTSRRHIYFSTDHETGGENQSHELLLRYA